MKTVAQELPAGALDQIIAQVAPQEAQNPELAQFRTYLHSLNGKQLGSLQEELKAAARVRGRKILMREKLLDRLGTDWLRRQQEMIEAALAKIEVARDTLDFNTVELELSGHMWGIGRLTNVPRLDEQNDPLVGMIKQQQSEQEVDVMGGDSGLDDEKLESIFGMR